MAASQHASKDGPNAIIRFATQDDSTTIKKFMKTHLRLVVIIAFLPFANMGAQDTPALRHGLVFGTFSDLRYVDESGDVIGTEITVIPQYRTAYAIVQCAEGAPTDPIFVPVQIKGNRINFQVDKSQPCSGTYTGVITLRGMTLSARNSDSVGNGFLPRRKSYWAR